MHDIKWIRENPKAFDAALARRGLEPLSGMALSLDEKWRQVTTDIQALQARRNEVAKAVGMAKKNGEDADALVEEANQIKQRIAELEADTTQDELNALLAGIPNILAEDVPEGADESANQQVRIHGQKPGITGAKQHFELGEALGQMDFERAATISGARFVYLTGDLARLERALVSFMLDMHGREFGYTEVVPPFLVNDNALLGTGQLPKFADDLFKTTDGRWLIPTAEVPLTNLAHERIFAAEELPLRLTAYTPCFRSEAGSAGKDTRGMIRQHQFSKVELVSITHPDESWNELERMTSVAEEVLKRLGLHYRVMMLCAGDTGFGAKKTYDLEVWLPGQDAYREISSCSNTGDFQARRMRARFREKGEKQTQFVHTLNGSALAIGRTIVAVLENYQQANGSIAIPDVLQPYMGGQKVIEAA